MRRRQDRPEEQVRLSGFRRTSARSKQEKNGPERSKRRSGPFFACRPGYSFLPAPRRGAGEKRGRRALRNHAKGACSASKACYNDICGNEPGRLCLCALSRKTSPGGTDYETFAPHLLRTLLGGLRQEASGGGHGACGLLIQPQHPPLYRIPRPAQLPERLRQIDRAGAGDGGGVRPAPLCEGGVRRH